MRISLAMIGVPILLSGCGLPPAVTLASWTIDALSYVVSGKSVTDHAISEVVAQDCALFRVVQSREICEDFELDDGSELILTAESFEGGATLEIAEIASDSAMLLLDPLFIKPEIASFVKGFDPETIAVSSSVPTAAFVPVAVPVSTPFAAPTSPPAGYAGASPKPRPAYQTVLHYEREPLKPQLLSASLSDFLGDAQEGSLGYKIATPLRVVSVIGSFKYLDNARGLAARQMGLNAQVRQVLANGKRWHRVVVDAPLEDVQRAGFEDAWSLRVCSASTPSPACGNTDL
jgi:hypothetical protein